MFFSGKYSLLIKKKCELLNNEIKFFDFIKAAQNVWGELLKAMLTVIKI